MNAPTISYPALLPDIVGAVEEAGGRLLDEPVHHDRPTTIGEIAAAIHAGDQTSLGVLRPRLEQARPAAGWVDDELDAGALPAGEWWIVDPVEGAINRVHGISEWAVTATLVRDNQPVLTVVHLPVAATTYTAVLDGGAFQDGVRLRTSAKASLPAALVGTGQASPRERSDTFQTMGRSITAMLERAGVVQVSVPATLQLIHLAAGRTDVFWQHSAVRSGLVAGALLVTEAGGTVSDIQGRPWSLTSDDFLAATPGLHQAAIDALAAAR